MEDRQAVEGGRQAGDRDVALDDSAHGTATAAARQTTQTHSHRGQGIAIR